MSARAAIHAMFPLDEASTAELDTRLNALIVEALIKAGVQYIDCPVCGAAQPVGGECGTCAFKVRMAAELAARGMVAAPEVAPSPDFFQRGRTYLYTRLGWKFRCDAVTSHPDTGLRVAVGYSRFGHGKWQTGDLTEGIWAEGGWTDVTEAGGRRG